MRGVFGYYFKKKRERERKILTKNTQIINQRLIKFSFSLFFFVTFFFSLFLL